MGVKFLSMRKMNSFSLLELAIVLTVVAVMVAISTSGLNSQISAQEIITTKQNISIIQKALENYRNLYGKYPCPSLTTMASSHANYGNAETNCYSACPAGLSCVAHPVNGALYTMAQGSVPFKTLGIPESASIDGWKSKITYAVDARFTQSENNCEVNGVLIISDYNGNTITDKAVITLISHGLDQKGASQPNSGAVGIGCDVAAKDGANCDNNTAYKMSDITKSNVNTSYYDDIISYVTNSKYKSCPAGLKNCQVWLDAADKCTITTNTGGVEQLNDKSPNGWHATQSFSSNRPDYPGPKQNGINTIQFNPSNSDALYVSSPTLSDGPFTIVTVFASQTLNWNTCFNIVTDGASYWAGAYDRSMGFENGSLRYYYWTTGVIVSSINTLNDYRPHIAIGSVGTTSGGQLFIDGTSYGSLSGTQSDFNWRTTVIIGSHHSLQVADYDLLEYLYLNKELTSAERKSLEQYLAAKWGVRLN